jgi:hypothetical protein
VSSAIAQSVVLRVHKLRLEMGYVPAALEQALQDYGTFRTCPKNSWYWLIAVSAEDYARHIEPLLRAI